MREGLQANFSVLSLLQVQGFFVFLPVILILSFLPLSTLSASVPEPLNYSVHVWQTEDGLPQNAVSSIVQTRDGYLWIGTYGGLVRFDGVRFTVFDSGSSPDLQNSRITSLFEDAEGTLWIGHETGDVTSLRGGHFKSIKVSSAWKKDKIVGIGATSAGSTWLLNQAGVLERVEDGQVLAPEIQDASVGQIAIVPAGAGRLWLMRSGGVALLDHDRLNPLPFANPAGFVFGIAASSDGSLWVVIDGRVRKWRGQQWVEDWGPCPWGQSSVTAMVELSNHGLAVGTLDQGLYLLRTNHQVLHFSRANGLPHDWVRSLCEDREGNLWAGAGSGGLVALRPARVSVLNAPDGWQGRSLLSVTAGRQGALWIGTEGSGIYRYQQGAWSHFGEGEGVSNPFVWSITEDSAGQIWAGTWGGGLLSLHGNRFEPARGLGDTTVPMPALFSPPGDSGLWIGTGVGLLRYQNGQGTWFGHKEGLDAADVRTVTQDGEGAIWFGVFGGGLGRLQNGALRQFRRSDGLSSDFIQCLLPDRDGVLWIGTADGGLNRFKNGRFSVIGTSQGLPNNVICHIADDGRGFFWMSSHHGIFRVAKGELNQCADGQITTVRCLAYGRSDGLPTLECSGGLQPAGCRTADGKIWFTTSKGLVAVDPENVFTNPVPPSVVIEELKIEGNFFEMSTGEHRLKIPAGLQRFEFRYTGLSFAAPEKIQFRCRLEGLERDWIDAGAKRTASYSYLVPGDYTFRVSACNNDGVWNERGAELSFTVLPFFWQTWWFRGAAGAGAMAAAGISVLYGVRRRIRTQLERAERQHAVERERARIAQDIHDDLGASLTRITLLSQTARAELENPKQAAADLDRIYGTARELTRALDEIVWAVNPRHDTLDSLASYLSRFAQDFLAPARLRCRLDVPVQLPAWPLTAEVRHNLFLAFKEALNNIVKHAAASEVRIALALEPAAFALSVEDDGRGFDKGQLANAHGPSADRPSRGNGLTNMQRRLEEIGGRCEIASEPGRGTRIKFLIAVHGAVAS